MREEEKVMENALRSVAAAAAAMERPQYKSQIVLDVVNAVTVRLP